jgi:hypothetical protein
MYECLKRGAEGRGRRVGVDVGIVIAVLAVLGSGPAA